jgi:hypothetical protein
MAQLRQQTSLDDLVDSRIQLARVAGNAAGLPAKDKQVITRLIDGTTGADDWNDVRRLRRMLSA